MVLAVEQNILLNLKKISSFIAKSAKIVVGISAHLINQF